MAGKDKTEPTRQKFACYLPEEAIARIRRAAYHTNQTIGEIVDHATADYVARLEKKQGKPFGPIGRLRAGRPISDAE